MGAHRGMRVIGIDPGIARTGYAVLDTSGQNAACVESGVITTLAGEPFGKRLHQIYQALAERIDRHRPGEAALEKVFHSRNTKAALNLGHARGVAMLAAVQAGIEVFEYSPLEIKQAVVGYGRADKHQVQEMVTKLLGLSQLPPPDAADAMAAALCHTHSAEFLRKIS